MAVTKSWEARVLATGSRAGGTGGGVGWREFGWLAASSAIVSAGLLLVYSAKTQDLPRLSTALARGELLDLNRVSQPEQLLPFLQVFPSEPEREQAAGEQ